MLAEPHGALLHALRSLLEAENGVRIVAEAADARQVLELVSRLSPRTVVLDLRAPALKRVKLAAGTKRSAERYQALTPREREVLRHVVDGLSSAQIADRLGISARTVEAHRAEVMRKLGVRKRTELLRYAFTHGLVPPRG